MTEYRNQLDQPLGAPMSDWTPREWPSKSPMVGRYCALEPLNPQKHASQLFEAFSEDKDHRLWTYLPYGPFESFDDYVAWMKRDCMSNDPFFYAVIEPESSRAVGVASYLRIQPAMGVIEVGHINYTPKLQKTRAATEVMFLMMQRAFEELGFRRYEWKCDSLNEGSRRAAVRLGFTFEGVFRQAGIYKGRSRDTAWYSIIDAEWSKSKRRFESWLDPSNFDSDGRQISRMSEFITD